jgi:hypothetical protein
MTCAEASIISPLFIASLVQAVNGAAALTVLRLVTIFLGRKLIKVLLDCGKRCRFDAGPRK